MHTDDSIKMIPLSDANSSGCGCGGHDAGGCACGGHEGSGHQHGGHTHQDSHAAHGDADAGLVTTEMGVTGMTCGHCVMSVTEELGEIDGVDSVDVQLNAGGVSAVTISSKAPLDPAAVRAAVSAAGNYSLAEA